MLGSPLLCLRRRPRTRTHLFYQLSLLISLHIKQTTGCFGFGEFGTTWLQLVGSFLVRQQVCLVSQRTKSKKGKKERRLVLWQVVSRIAPLPRTILDRKGWVAMGCCLWLGVHLSLLWWVVCGCITVVGVGDCTSSNICGNCWQWCGCCSNCWQWCGELLVGGRHQ